MDWTNQQTPYSKKVFVGLDHAIAAFNVVNKVLNGETGPNLVYIANETGANVTLRGRGTFFLEPDGKVSSEPLHIKIEHKQYEGLKKAVQLTRNLVETVAYDYQEFLQCSPVGPPTDPAMANTEQTEEMKRKNPSTSERREAVKAKLVARGVEWDPTKWKRGRSRKKHDTKASATPGGSSHPVERHVGRNLLDLEEVVSHIFHEEEEELQDPHSEKVFVGLEDAHPSFNVISKVMGGVTGPNLNFITNLTGATVTLRGVGISFSDPDGKISSEPLHMNIEHKEWENLRKAVDLAKNLVKTVKYEYQAFAQFNLPAHAPAPPMLMPPPILIPPHPLVSPIFGPLSAQLPPFNRPVPPPEKEVPHVSTAKEKGSIRKLEEALELLDTALQIYCLTVTDEKVKFQLDDVIRLVQFLFNHTIELKKSKHIPEITKDIRTKIVLLVQYLDKLFESQPSIQVAQFVPILKLLKESIVYRSHDELSTSIGEKKGLCNTDKPLQSTSALQRHAEVLQRLQFLETNLESHTNAMSLGKPKIQLLQITENLHQVLQTHKGNTVSDKDQNQFMLIMQLLETLFQSQDLQTSTGHSPTAVVEIVQEVQQLLRNLSSADLVQESLPEVEQRLGSRKRRFEMEAPSVAAKRGQPLSRTSAQPAQSRQISDPQTVELTQIKQMLQIGLESLTSLSAPDTQSGNPELNQLLQQMQQVTQLLQNKQQTIPEQRSESFTAMSGSSQKVEDSFQGEDNHIKLQQVVCPKTIKKSSLVIGGEEKKVILVEPDIKSLYASLAYLLQGPFETHEELSLMALKFRKETVNFIRSNKDLFFIFVNKAYREIFPSDTLDHNRAFEKYCLFLGQSKILKQQVPLQAIATAFKTPIAVSCKNGLKNVVQPLILTKIKRPVEIFDGGSLNFCPLIQPELTFATWHVTRSQTLEVQAEQLSEIDLYLNKHNVDVACVQGSKAPTTFGSMSTPNYIWWCTRSFSSNGVAFLIHKSSGITLKDFISSEGFVSGEIKWKDRFYCLFGCDFSDSQNKDYFTRCLSKVLSQNTSNVQVIVLGDFNALVGSSSALKPDEKKLIGRNLFHRISNEFGMILKDLAIKYSFRIVTSFPNENNLPEYTLKNKNGMFQVSHILMGHQPNQWVKNYLHWEEGYNQAIVASKISYEKPTHVDEVKTKNDFEVITFSTWSTGDCSSADSQETIDTILFDKAVDLACIQGTNLVQGTLHTTHYDWWCCGSSRSPNNVALLLRRNSRATLRDFEARGSSVASAVLTVGECRYAVVGCYLPDNLSSTYNDVACDIMLSLNIASPSARLLLLGDFTAILGHKDLKVSEEPHLARKGLLETKSNANGIFLKRLALLHDLFICSTDTNVEQQDNFNHHTSHILLRKGNSLRLKGLFRTYRLSPQKPWLITFSIPWENYYIE